MWLTELKGRDDILNYYGEVEVSLGLMVSNERSDGTRHNSVGRRDKDKETLFL
jgi:hypothetical protein